MPKAVLVIDMPYDCYACKIAANPNCIKMRNVTGNSGIKGQRPQYCPLEPLSEAVTIEWLDTYCTDSDIGLRDNDPVSIKKLLEDWKEENAGS